MEYSASQVTACSCSHPGSKETDKDAGRHSQKGKAHHLAACNEQVINLYAVHIHSQSLVCALYISNRRLLENCVRHFSHLLLHALNHGFSLFIGKKSKYIEDSHLVHPRLVRHICTELSLYLFRHIASGLKPRDNHHRSPKNTA